MNYEIIATKRFERELKQKGKSGGARIISFVYTQKEKVYLLAIYDKSDISNMGENAINSRISELEL